MTVSSHLTLLRFVKRGTMKITVLGCGSIGKLWVAALTRQSHEVQGWLRVPQPFLDVSVDNINGEPFYQRITANQLEWLKQSELLIVCLKSWQVSDAVNALLPFLSAQCPILLIHNGMGTADELTATQHSISRPILQGIITHGAYQQGQDVIHTATGITHIGPLNHAAQQYSYLAETLHHALPDVAWHNDIHTISWLKLAVNCVINPLTVYYQCRNGDLLRYPEHIQKVCDEVYLVMEREGVVPTSQAHLHGYIIDTIEQTANNYSSMYQDVKYQRHTEIDYITGYLLRRASEQGLVLPENNHLFQFIKQQEGNYDHISAHLPS